MGLIRRIDGDAREHFAEIVAQWGYPRAVSEREISTGAWYTNGDAIVWYVWPLPAGVAPPPGFEDVLAVHGIADPQRKAQALTPRMAVALEVIGELLGAHKLYSLIPRETPNMPVKAMRRYLRRYGWVEDEFGSYKLLGGG